MKHSSFFTKDSTKDSPQTQYEGYIAHLYVLRKGLTECDTWFEDFDPAGPISIPHRQLTIEECIKKMTSYNKSSIVSYEFDLLIHHEVHADRSIKLSGILGGDDKDKISVLFDKIHDSINKLNTSERSSYTKS